MPPRAGSAATTILAGSRPGPPIVREQHPDRLDLPQPGERCVVGGRVGSARSTLATRRARPLVETVDGLAAENDGAVGLVDDDRLVAGRMTRCREDADAGDEIVVAVGLDPGHARPIDPLLDRVAA